MADALGEKPENGAKATPPPIIVRKRKSTVLLHALSGTLGSLLAECILFPVDTIKLHVQTASAENHLGVLGTGLRIVGREGICGFYRGIQGSIIKESIHSLNFWLWHGLLFQHVSQGNDTSLTPPTTRLVLNLIAKQLNWLCTVPFEVVSSVNQLAEGGPGFIATAVSLYRTGGLASFYRGLGVSLLLAINPAIMNTLITSWLRVATAIRQARGDDYFVARDHSAALVGFVTGLSKVVATSLTYPLIRAKVLQQTRPPGAPTTIVEVLRWIVTTEGFTGLYRGVVALSIKTVLWNSLMMGFKHLLGPQRAITPPCTPPNSPYISHRRPTMPLMARDPFPVELLTVEKLNEILSHLQREKRDDTGRRVETMERKLGELSDEMREIKELLAGLAGPRPPHGRAGASPGGRRVGFVD